MLQFGADDPGQLCEPMAMFGSKNRTRQVFETDAGTAWNPSNLPA
jgi:hypothetical protein